MFPNNFEGEAALTEFTISCSGWKDEGAREEENADKDLSTPLLYSFYQGKDELLIGVTSTYANTISIHHFVNNSIIKC